MSRRLLFAFAACIAAPLSLPATAADVGVSVNIGQPGFYGRIDIGSFPPPPVIYAQPVLIAPAPVAIVQGPIYLRVPPGHAKDWAKHCRRYNACGQRTYFVEEDWYHTVYAPARGYGRPEGRHRQAPRPGYVAHPYPQEMRGDGHDRSRGHEKDRGKGHGKSKGKSKD